MNGVSLTHGKLPQQQIWTFAGALWEMGITSRQVCLCTLSDIPYTPLFVTYMILETQSMSQRCILLYTYYVQQNTM